MVPTGIITRHTRQNSPNMNKFRLYTAGPTPIPPDATLAMARPIEYHRSEGFREVVRDIEANLQYVCQTSADIAILASTGTGAMECALVNLFSPRDEVIAIRSGKFGERWAEIASAYGLNVLPIDLEWGTSIDPAQVQSALNAHPHARGVLSTLCETSTGTLHDVRSLAKITRSRDVLLVCDAVSALGADEMRMDDWGIDALVSCSQKGLMTPPGLGLCAFGERALKASESARLPRYYFDFKKYRSNLAKGETPFTPAISLLVGLQTALARIREESIDNVLARHARMADATRKAAAALGLSLFSKSPANTVTAVNLPDGFDGKALVKRIRERHNVVFAGGQGHVAGKIVRIAHLGWMDDYDAVVAVAALERGLLECGYGVSMGAGVSAAQAALSKSDKG